MREIGRPGYFLMRLEPPERRPAPDRDQGVRGRLTVEITCRTPLHIGSGSPLGLGPDRKQLVGGIAAVRGDGDALAPIIPGSSLKGAVRAVVEAITPSCERVSARGADGARPCRSAAALCPACRIFGAPGWRSTIGFGDLAPAQGVTVTMQRVGQRYSHRNAPRRGRRLYRPSPEEPLPDKEETLAVVAAGGRFRGAIYLDGVDREGLGLVLLALGIPPQGLPYLRLGGGKNRGLGIVDAEVRAGRVYGSLADWLAGRRLLSSAEEVDRLFAEAQVRAINAHPQTPELLERIRREYSTGATGDRP